MTRRTAAALLGAALLSVPVLLQTSAAFTASTNNSLNTTQSALVFMEQKEYAESARTTVVNTCLSTDGNTTNASTCTTINQYGGATSITPGYSKTVYLTVKNTGLSKASGFALSPGVCTKTDSGSYSGTGNLCDALTISVTAEQGSVPIFTGSPSALRTGGVIDLIAKLGRTPTVGIAKDEVINLEVNVSLGSGEDNSVMGQQASQPLLWTFTA